MGCDPMGSLRWELGLFARTLAGPSAGLTEHEELRIGLRRQVPVTAVLKR